MKRALVIFYFAVLAFDVTSGPTGFEDKAHYFILPLCLIGCVVVVRGVHSKLTPHILWASFCAVSLTHVYRFYAEARWQATSARADYDRVIDKIQTKKEPNSERSVSP